MRTSTLNGAISLVLLGISAVVMAPVTAQNNPRHQPVQDPHAASGAQVAVDFELPAGPLADALDDAIVDRLIHSSHKLALKGESMRKKKAGAAAS